MYLKNTFLELPFQFPTKRIDVKGNRLYKKVNLNIQLDRHTLKSIHHILHQNSKALAISYILNKLAKQLYATTKNKNIRAKRALVSASQLNVFRVAIFFNIK